MKNKNRKPIDHLLGEVYVIDPLLVKGGNGEEDTGGTTPAGDPPPQGPPPIPPISD